MKKNIRNIILSTATLLMAGFVSVGATTLQNASADTTETTYVENTFEMVAGASLRLNSNYNGIRYQAKISPDVVAKVDKTAGDYFGMIVIPETYLEKFATELANGNNDYVPVLTEALEAKGYSLWNRTEIVEYEGDEANYQDSNYYYINGVVSNVLYANYNLERLAIAYYADATTDEETGETTYTYTYATNYMETLRSIADVADAAIKDIETYQKDPYDADDRKVLYGYDYTAKYQKAGLDQPTAEALNSYATNAVNSENSTTLLTFDEPDSSGNYKKATLTTNNAFQYYGKNTTFTLDTNGENSSNALTVSSGSKYRGVSLMFRPVKVEAGMSIGVRIWSNPNTLRVVALNSTVDVTTVSTTNVSAGSWQTLSIKATDLANVGELLSGFDLYIYLGEDDAANRNFRIDSVSVSYEPVLADNELINFNGTLVDYSDNVGQGYTIQSVNANYAYYPKLVTPTVLFEGDENYLAPEDSVEDNGVVYAPSAAVGSTASMGGVKVTFDVPLTVSNSTTIEVNCYTVCSALYVENKEQNAIVQITTPTNNAWTKFVVDPTAIGYAEGETVATIEILFQSTSSVGKAVMYIDTVTIGAKAVLADNELINFDNSAVDYSANYSAIQLYSSVNATLCDTQHAKPTLVRAEDAGSVADKEGSGYVCANARSGGYAGVSITFNKSITITANTTFTFRYYKVQKEGTNNGNTWFAKPNYPSSVYQAYAGHFGKWATVSVKATDIGFAEGEIATGVQVFSAGVTAFYIDWITFAEV